MAASDIQLLIDLLAGGKGVLGLLVILIVGSFFEVWVWGKDYRKLERERDRWQALALSTTSLAREAMRSQVSRTKEPG